MTAFMIPFLPRLMLGGLILYLELDGFFAPDAVGYTMGGGALALVLQSSGVEALALIAESGQGRYTLLNGLVFSLFGEVSLFMVALTAAAGAWTAILAGRIARQLGGVSAGRRAYWLVALFPSLVLWSALNLRDAFLILALTGVVWSAIEIREQARAGPIIRLLLWLALLIAFREYMFFVAVLGVMGALVVHSWRNLSRRLMVALVVAGLGLVAWQSLPGAVARERMTLESLGQIRGGFSGEAASGYGVTPDEAQLADEVSNVPVGLGYFLFAPFPWSVAGTLPLLTVPEVLLWYALFPFVWVGIQRIRKARTSGLWPVLAMIIAVCIFYALVSGNVGTAYRHRAQVLPLFLVLIAVGLGAMERWRGSSVTTAAEYERMHGAGGVRV